MTRAERRAQLHSPGDWGRHGSADAHIRYAKLLPARYRRRCHCGCGGKASHAGTANGVALMTGCELAVQRWVCDGGSK